MVAADGSPRWPAPSRASWRTREPRGGAAGGHAAGTPRVSVVVPAYGVAAFLGEALASLQAQSLADWEAVVVDDGDREGAASAFAPFAGDPRIRLLQTDNAGVSAARNRGVAATRAEVIAFLDGDDLYEPDYLQRMVEALRRDPDVGFVACDARLFGPGERAGRLYSEAYPMNGPVTLERVLTRQVNIFTATMARRCALEDVGGFDPDLRLAEDLDLWIRMLARGWSAAIVPAPLVCYRRRPGSLSSSLRPLLRGCCTVYERAADMLDGRPEATIAEAMAGQYGRKLAWAQGEALILEGNAVAGLELLRGAAARSLRWRLALAVMRRAPWLAKPLLQLRPWLPRPRRR